jgi:predicted transposase YdaD
VRRDAIFYTLFKRSPNLLFELVGNPPANAQNYRFESVEIKESNFRIDGVFLPPDTDRDRTVQMIEQGKQLIAQANQRQTENLSRQDIIEVVTAIAVYKLTTIDRTEVEAMLGINLEESRIYQEISAEGEQRGKLTLVPLLLELGLTLEQIADRTGIALEIVQQTIAQHAQTNQKE